MAFKEATLKAKLIGSAVESIEIVEPGLGYKNPKVIIDPPAPAEPATAKAINKDGSVEKLEYINSGNGYISSPSIDIEPPENGTQAKAHIEMSFGILDDIILLEGGSGYKKEPKVDIFYPHLIPTICDVSLEVDEEGKINKVRINENGTGYKNIPNIKVIENESV